MSYYSFKIAFFCARMILCLLLLSTLFSGKLLVSTTVCACAAHYGNEASFHSVVKQHFGHFPGKWISERHAIDLGKNGTSMSCSWSMKKLIYLSSNQLHLRKMHDSGGPAKHSMPFFPISCCSAEYHKDKFPCFVSLMIVKRRSE